MGLIDKFKNLFTEEVEVEEKPEKKEGVQKEVIQVEIPSPKKNHHHIEKKFIIHQKKKREYLDHHQLYHQYMEY